MLTKESIVTLLQNDKRAVARALVVLTARQTADEQATEHTRHLNGRGFRPCHARMGTNMAQFFQRQGYLTDKQIAYWRMKDKSGAMRIGIYAGQLLEEAELKQKQAEAYALQGLTLLGEIATQRMLENELGMVLDSEDPTLIKPAKDALDNFMAQCRNKT